MNDLARETKPWIKETKPWIALVSASLSKLGRDKNKKRTEFLADLFKDRLTEPWKFAPVKGCYKGQKEDSFKVNVSDPIDLGLVEKVARFFDQESYLLIDSNRIAWLWFLNGDVHRLGSLVAASAAEAMAQEAWTFDPESGTYFIVK